MFFDVKANLAEVLNQEATPATRATSATQGANVASVADVAGGHPENQKTEIPHRAVVSAADPHDTAHPSRLSVGGSPCTWTGKVVSLEEWKRLTDWERHGPNGRHWNALSRKWEYPA
jgi:hypothetical protein